MAGLRQAELAVRIGASPQTVWGLENGEHEPIDEKESKLHQTLNQLGDLEND
jgi:transcriptional regulator with XRE-family HTH domain